MRTKILTLISIILLAVIMVSLKLYKSDEGPHGGVIKQTNDNNYLIETKNYTSNNSVQVKKVSNEPIVVKENIISQENNEAFLKMAKQKIEIQHKINILKIQKEKIEESKRIFENDLKLFNLFNESKQKDSNFEIPELFNKKYEIMIKLNNDNKLNWDEFVKEFHTGENNYDDYFCLNNYYA